ncbi:MAG: stage II sporulation protein M [Desulfurococcales archaeon]|nr:stage II sporulation protein M [Desulfurococcales archaeon]
MRRPDNIIDDYLLDTSIKVRTLSLVVLFAITMILSTLYWPEVSSTPIAEYVKRSYSDVEENVDLFRGATYLLIPLYIFVRNLLVVTLSTILSVTVIIPFAIVVFNGSIIGFVIRRALTEAPIMQSTNPGPLVIASLLPHGSIEIPAIAIATSTAFYFVDKLMGRRVEFSRVARRNLLLAGSILVFSALVEAFITPLAVIILLILQII